MYAPSANAFASGISRRMRCLALFGLCAVALLVFGRTASARDSDDQRDLDAMRAQNAHAADLLERGETFAARGRLDEGIALFRKAGDLLPNSALPKRRICEGMTALGRGPEALHQCYQSMEIARTNIAVRALVRALVFSPDTPTLPHVAEAMMFAVSEHAKAPNHWVLSSALCDIAERIGDLTMLEKCTSELVRLAPAADETRQAVALLDAGCPPWRFWAGWLALGAAVAATAAHALRRRAGRAARRPLAAVGAAAVGLGILLGAGPVARADEKPEWLTNLPINEDDPERTIPSEQERNKDPLQFGYWLQDVALKAEVYSQHGQHDKSIKFYRALAKAVPDRALSFSRLCTEYEAVGDREKAIAACGAAITLQGVTQADYAHYVHLVLGKTGSLSSQDVGFLNLALDAFKRDPQNHPLADQLECEVGTRTSNVPELKECTAALTSTAPHDRQTVVFQWALAMQEGHLDDARRLLARAKELGEDDESAKSMQRAIDAAAKRKHLHEGLAVVAALFLAAAAVVLARYFARRRTAPPAVVDATASRTTSLTA